MTTIIITGGRSIAPTERYALGAIVVPWLVEQGVTRVVHGEARGFGEDTAIACMMRGIEAVCVPAGFTTRGPATGPIRNERMIREWADKAAFLLEFPGSRGPADYTKLAASHGLPVVRVVPGRGPVALKIQDPERAVELIRAKKQEMICTG